MSITVWLVVWDYFSSIYQSFSSHVCTVLSASVFSNLRGTVGPVSLLTSECLVQIHSAVMCTVLVLGDPSTSNYRIHVIHEKVSCFVYFWLHFKIWAVDTTDFKVQPMHTRVLIHTIHTNNYIVRRLLRSFCGVSGHSGLIWLVCCCCSSLFSISLFFIFFLLEEYVRY